MSDERATVVHESSGNVFEDLGLADAHGHKLKAELVLKLSKIVEDRKLTQTAAAKIVGTSQPDLSRLLKGHFRDVSAERLIKMLQRLGSEVEITVRREGKDVGEAIHLHREYA